MTASYRQQVAAAIEATAILSPVTFSWRGRRFGDLPRAAARALSPEASRQYLVRNLRDQMYDGFYCHGVAASSAERLPLPPVTGFTPFVQALSAANHGRGSVEPGWRLSGGGDSELVIERDGLRLWATPADVVETGDAGSVGVRLPRELLRLSPGFYMALGDRGLTAGEDVLRFYWNLRSEGAPRFVRRATGLLNQRGVPFRLKVANEPAAYTRHDAGVLYVPSRDYRTVAPVVAAVYREVALDLGAAVPALTKRLAPGLGLAEDPGDGKSFGTHRCALIAEGIADAHEQAATSAEARFEHVARRFEAAGISLDAPFLNPGSSDDYECLA